MKIEEITKDIINNYDNLEILDITKYLIEVVIKDIEYMNDLMNEEEKYDLGNDYVIGNDDLESLVSITETIYQIKEYNTKGEN